MAQDFQTSRSIADVLGPRPEAAPKDKTRSIESVLGPRPEPKPQSRSVESVLGPRPQGQRVERVLGPRPAAPQEDSFGLSPGEIGSYFMEHNMLLNLAHGTARIYHEFHDDPVKAARETKNTLGNAVHKIANLNATDVHEFFSGAKGTINNIVEAFKTHPKAATGALVKGILADPELFFVPEISGGAAAARFGTLASRLGGAATTIGKTLPAFGRAVSEITTSGALMTMQEFSEQYKTGEYNAAALKNALDAGLVLGSVGWAAKAITRGKAAENIPETLADTRYASTEEALRVAQDFSLGGQWKIANPRKGEKRYYVYTAEEGKKAKYFEIREAKPGVKPNPEQFHVDLTKEQLHTLEQTPEGYLFPKNRKEELYRSSGIEIPLEKFMRITQEKFKDTPQAIIPFLLKNAPPAIATAAIFAGLGVMLTDQPVKNVIFGASVLGLGAGTFNLINNWPSGNRGIIEGLAQVGGYIRNAEHGSEMFRQSASAAVGKTGLQNILKSYDKSLGIKLTPEELTVKGSFERTIFAVIAAAKDAGITLNLFDEVLPLKIKTSAGRIVDPKQLNLRKIETFKDLEEKLHEGDLELGTGDITDVVDYMLRSVLPKIVNKQLMQGLVDYRHPDTLERLVIKATDQEYKDYVQLPKASGFDNYRVHKDIASAVAALVTPQGFEGAFQQSLLALASSLKRFEVSMSMFHAKTLYDGAVGALGVKSLDPRKFLELGYKTYLGAGNTKLLKDLIQNGLVLGANAVDVDVEAMNNFVSMIGHGVDRVIPGKFGTKVAHSIAEANHAIDAFTFGYVQNGYKIATALAKYEQLVGKGVNAQEALRASATFANDIFGGQNWFRVMNSSANQVMRNFGNKMITGGGMGWMRILMFAPDWKFSTFRSIYKALPGVSDKTTKSLYAGYALKSAIYYLTVANALNYIFTGHSVFANHDPTRVEFGKTDRGTDISGKISKHSTELLDFAQNPVKFILSSINPMTKLPFQALLNEKYLSPGGAPPIVYKSDTPVEEMEHIFAAALEPFIPISAQALKDPTKAYFGFFGMPILGATTEEQQESKRKSKEERRAKRQESQARRGISRNENLINQALEYLGVR